MNLRALLLSWLSLALLLTACAPQSSAPAIEVEDPWGPAVPSSSDMAAFYMVLHNRGAQPDRLIAASSPACSMTELHQSILSSDGVMRMQQVRAIEIPARGRVELKPGGLHVMCMHKKAAFAVGDTYSLTLTFEKAGPIQVQVSIRNP